MSVHEILGKHIRIEKHPKWKGMFTRYKKMVEKVPAAITYFSIKELLHMLQAIQQEPLKETFVFGFKHGKYIVTVYDPNSV